MRDYYPYSYYEISPQVREKLMHDILHCMRKYDAYLDRFVFTPECLIDLNKILTTSMIGEGLLNKDHYKNPVSLSNPQNLRDLLSEIDIQMGLDIKRWRNFPVYFLFRCKYDSYQQHYVLLEELYCSKNYPGTGQRFIRLRSGYGEKIFLNAVPYRAAIQYILRGKKKRKDFGKRVNFSLNQVAEVLNLAWDEDFELTRRLCAHLKIRHITGAMEVTHLILGTEDFSWLRERPKVVRDFFDNRYDHPDLGVFLKQIQDMDYRQWIDQVDQAKKHYLTLKLALSGLLNLEVSTWVHPASMPLWKWVFTCHDKEFPQFEINNQLTGIIRDVEEVATRVLETAIYQRVEP